MTVTCWPWELQRWFNIMRESSHFLDVFHVKSISFSFGSQTGLLEPFLLLRSVGRCYHIGKDCVCVSLGPVPFKEV